MKFRMVFTFVAVCLLGCSHPQNENPEQPTAVKHEIQKVKRLSLSDDFVMGEPFAVSNAVYFKGPPPGWSIACDGNGSYAPCAPGGTVIDYPGGQTLRTNYFEATVAAWRTKMIWDAPVSVPVPELGHARDWKTCDAQ